MEKNTAARRSAAKPTTWGGIALAVLIALYSFARPMLSEQFGWKLPAFTGTGQAEVADAKPAASPVSPQSKSVEPGALTRSVRKPTSDEPSKAMKDAPVARKPSVAPETKPTFNPVPKTVPKTVPAAEDRNLVYGLLKDIGGDRFVSPAGLMFTRGSAEGHRLDHLERHTEDDPNRPGKHGVFDGGMAGALKTIDRAYERAKTGQRTTKEIDEGRTVYTVDMGSRVGYIGGRDGSRQKKPMARRVRLVLDQNRVITAFPL